MSTSPVTPAPAPAPAATDAQVRAIFRRGAWVAAIVALVAGVLALAFPGAALTVVALFVGVYLIVTGIMRISTAVSASSLRRSWRGLLGLVGALLVVAGVIVLNNPFGSLVALVIVTAIGWIIDGVGYLLAAFRLGAAAISWPFALAGVALVVAGIVLLVLPREALGAVFLGIAVLLIVIGAVGIVGLALSQGRAARAPRPR
ncbi:MAG: DUF308 domain-containing protein [Actinomycetales bacterium]|nr:DUF308 domain-containing protein [Actinomycetales bacterium]